MASPRTTALPYQTLLLARNWLSRSAFELILEKPEGFSHRPGQKVTLAVGAEAREYSLVSSPEEETLGFCVRLVEGGMISTRLAEMAPGDPLRVSAACGFFIHRKGRAVCVATGTGVAPFVSFCRSGIRDVILLHGVRDAEDLYYREELGRCASRYVPCLSGGATDRREDVYSGRVTDYLRDGLPGEEYDFYLCGNGAMIRDAIRIIDSSYPNARIFTETFHH